jgi:pimeloyl-ACP methyl ester carboxylesterase
METLALEVDGLTVRAQVQGEGEPLVLVHGLGTSAATWAKNIDALARCARVYAVDLPGFGESEKPEEILPPDRLADLLAAWCRAAGISRASFAGHSIGGEICLWLAHRHPDLPVRLVLAASTGAAPRAGLTRRLGRLLIDGAREPLRFMPVLLRAYWQARPWRIYETARRSRSPELLRMLPTIRVPTLVAWGRRDPVVSYAEARRLAAALPDARLAVIEGGAHGLIFDAPDRFNELVCAFLTNLDAGARSAVEEPRVDDLPA